MHQLPLTLLTAAAVQVSCQLFKVVLYSLRDGVFSPQYFVTAGGIPSSHSAFVTALLIAVGIRNGFNTDIFAVTFVFASIVIYDSFRLRGHVEKQARRINSMLRRLGYADEPLSEMIGHSLAEIAAGIIYGGTVSAALTLLFMSLQL